MRAKNELKFTALIVLITSICYFVSVQGTARLKKEEQGEIAVPSQIRLNLNTPKKNPLSGIYKKARLKKLEELNKLLKGEH